MQTGRLTQWNDERGFGFIAADNGERIFVHATAFARMANRPRTGDNVRFETRIGRGGRIEARSVQVAGANPLSQRRVRRLRHQQGSMPDWRFLVALVLTALLAVAVLLDRLSYHLPVIYALMCSVSLGLYRADKQFAETGQWRLSEILLHAVDLCFGIVGGLVGQALFRHKTRKPGYVATTIVLAGIHLVWVGALAFGLIDFGDVIALPALLVAP